MCICNILWPTASPFSLQRRLPTIRAQLNGVFNHPSFGPPNSAKAAPAIVLNQHFFRGGGYAQRRRAVENVHAGVCACGCVCACVRACVRACACMCVCARVCDV